MTLSNVSQGFIEKTEKYGANNYHPLPIVISEAEGVWVKDPEGNKYMDMLICIFSGKPRSSSS